MLFFHINQTENKALTSPEKSLWYDLFSKVLGNALPKLSNSRSFLEIQSLQGGT